MRLISLDLRRAESENGTGLTDWHRRAIKRHMKETAHFLDSGLREKVIEHLFIGDLLRCLWCQGVRDIEVLRAEVDRAGYDLVLEAGGVMRHVQFKASYRGAKTARVGIHTDLARKPGGCVIWIWFDPETMELGPFLWFGGKPGAPLPPLGERMGKHTRGDSAGAKATRPNIRIVGKGEFSTLPSMHDVAQTLFGRKTNQ